MPSLNKSFEIFAKCIPTQFIQNPTEKIYRGTDGGKPRCLLQDLKLRLDDVSVYISPKRYKDLANVIISHGIYLTTRKKTLVLHILGGDGAAAYEVRYLFQVRALIAREIMQLDENGESKTSDIRIRL